jgi:hypothetical protein
MPTSAIRHRASLIQSGDGQRPQARNLHMHDRDRPVSSGTRRRSDERAAIRPPSQIYWGTIGQRTFRRKGRSPTALQRMQRPRTAVAGNEFMHSPVYAVAGSNYGRPRLSQGDSGGPSADGKRRSSNLRQRRVGCDLVIVDEEACSSVHKGNAAWSSYGTMAGRE